MYWGLTETLVGSPSSSKDLSRTLQKPGLVECQPESHIARVSTALLDR